MARSTFLQRNSCHSGSTHVLGTNNAFLCQQNSSDNCRHCLCLRASWGNNLCSLMLVNFPSWWLHPASFTPGKPGCFLEQQLWLWVPCSWCDALVSLLPGEGAGCFLCPPKAWLGSCSRALSPACYICGNSTQRRCCKTVSPQWDVIEWKQMASWGEFQGRITFSSYCLFDFTVIVWWIVSDLILQIEKLLLNVLPNVQIK